LLNLTARMHQIEYKAAKLEAQKLQMANESSHVYDEYLNALDKTKVQLKILNKDGSIGYKDATYNNLTEAGYQIYFLDPKIGPVEQKIPEGYTTISSAADLEKIRSNPTGNFILMNDITLSGNWTPIENFSGTLDGNGHVIKGLSFNDFSSSEDFGFFRTVSGTVKNLGFKDVNISATNSGTMGTLCGDLDGGTVENCWVTDAEVIGNLYAGVLIGDVNNGVVRNCFTSGTINAQAYNAEPDNGYMTGDVIARFFGSTVSGCYTTGNYPGQYCGHKDATEIAEMQSRGELPGGTIITALESHKDDNEWLTNMINAGLAIISKKDNNGEYYETSVSTDTGLQEVSNEDDLKKAEAKYEADMKKINLKDRKYDTDLAALDTERNAIKQEMDTLKSVARDNVERTFKLFS